MHWSAGQNSQLEGKGFFLGTRWRRGGGRDFSYKEILKIALKIFFFLEEKFGEGSDFCFIANWVQ